MEGPLSFRMGVWGAEAFCLMAVNLYAMVTGYVCVLGVWRPSRYLRLWMQVAFYTVGFCVLRELLRQSGMMELSPMHWKSWVRAFFPVPFASVYWYFTAYTALFLLIPFINKFICSMSAAGLLRLFVLFFVVFCPAGFLFGDACFSGGYNAVWLVVLYIAGAYIRLHSVRVPVRWLVAGLIVAVCVSAAFAHIRFNYISPFTVLSTLCTFLLFERLEFKNAVAIKCIALLAPLSFGVYLVHVHPCSWAAMHRYMPRLFGESGYSWWLFVVTPIALYLACTLVDACRAWLFKLCHANALADAMERGLLRLWEFALKLLQRWCGAWFESERKPQG